jgi:hypothetical protein
MQNDVDLLKGHGTYPRVYYRPCKFQKCKKRRAMLHYDMILTHMQMQWPIGQS